MGTPSTVVLKVETPDHGHVVIEASDGMRYHTDLSSFSSVYCFPGTRERWNEVTQDACGLALVWTSRFEVHIDQVIALANRVEPSRQTA